METFGIGSCRLKKRLIRENLLEDKCSRCGIKEWQGEIISLELDHINGNHGDNSLENLRILCPNCHSLTPTHRGKNITKSTKKPKEFISKPKESISKLKPNCPDCGKIVSANNLRCKSCAGKQCQTTKINWPSVEELILMVQETSYTKVGKKLGVSDNAVRKRIKHHSQDIIISPAPILVEVSITKSASLSTTTLTPQ